MMNFLRSPSQRLVVLVACCISMPASPSRASSDESEVAGRPTSEQPDYGPLNAQIRSAIERDKPACVAVVRRRGRNVRTAFSAVIVSAEGHILTAGHCTEAPAERATVWFAEDVDNTPDFGTPAGYPFEGDVDGKAYTHPDYDPAAFFLYDLGVVVLDEPMVMDEYGELPELGVLDGIKGKDKKAALMAVGYGLQEINPVRLQADRVRLQAVLDVINTRGVFGMPSGTAVAVSGSGVGGDNSASGGTCFGDSGGPQFLAGTNTVVAVTSFGLNGNCAGTGGGYRVDQADDLDWLYSEFGDQLP